MTECTESPTLFIFLPWQAPFPVNSSPHHHHKVFPFLFPSLLWEPILTLQTMITFEIWCSHASPVSDFTKTSHKIIIFHHLNPLVGIYLNAVECTCDLSPESWVYRLNTRPSPHARLQDSHRGAEVWLRGVIIMRRRQNCHCRKMSFRCNIMFLFFLFLSPWGVPRQLKRSGFWVISSLRWLLTMTSFPVERLLWKSRWTLELGFQTLVVWCKQLCVCLCERERKREWACVCVSQWEREYVCFSIRQHTGLST